MDLSIGGIARELTTMGVATKSGQNCWKGSIIAYILRNERYNGDSLFQKCYGEDDVPFKERRNHGERDQFFAKNTHQAIVDSDVFDSVQTLLPEKKESIQKGRNSKQISAYLPHSVFRVWLFLSPEGAKWRNQVGLFKTRGGHYRL